MIDLNLTLIQQPLIAADPEANRKAFTQVLAGVEQTDLVVLPEVFTTSFSSGARACAETPGGATYEWMAQQADRLKAVVTGSLVVREGEHYFNRLVWMRPDGEYVEYNKRHLFRMADEHLRYQMGRERILVEVKGWRVLPLVCYDLRFPVWSRNRNDYDLAIYVANWPDSRALHWNRLLQARAIENLSYVVGVNRIGTDDFGQHYQGDSAVYGPAGEVVIHGGDQQGVIQASLSINALSAYRSAFPAHLDADHFIIES